MGCAWRNTTNSSACMSAQVGEYQHALEWNPANPLELFVGNDSGLWRSMDGIAESGPVCSSVRCEPLPEPQRGAGIAGRGGVHVGRRCDARTRCWSGLGANGTAGIKCTTGPTSQWPQILSGEGGPVAIDPANPDNWYVNNGVGVSIHRCSQTAPCTPADFGSTPVVSNADVNGDGLTMLWPAPFMVDPLDPSQLLIGTCRIWRGPANGLRDGPSPTPSAPCSMETGPAHPAMATRWSARWPPCRSPRAERSCTRAPTERLNGGATLPGHVLSATMDANGTWSAWQDLALNPVANDQRPFNMFAMDVSSLVHRSARCDGKHHLRDHRREFPIPSRMSAWCTGRATAGRTGTTFNPTFCHRPPAAW